MKMGSRGIRWITPTRLWVTVFACWLLFLSGAVAQLVGSPGALQLSRLRGLLHMKEQQLEHLKLEVERLETDSELLAKNKVAQQREIRRVLSYTAEDEIVFDFSADEPARQN